MKTKLFALTIIASLMVAQGMAVTKKTSKPKNNLRKHLQHKKPEATTTRDPTSLELPPHPLEVEPIQGPFPVFQEKK